MKLTRGITLLMLLSICCSCAVVSKDVTREALSERPLNEMVEQSAQLIGKTLVLGGYIVSVANHQSHTQIIAVHAPLGIGQQPKSKDLSKGRLIIKHDGFLDPEVYTKDRVITVGGKVLGSSKTDNSAEPYPYLRLEALDIYLWPLEDPKYREPNWYYDCYPYHYPRWRGHYHPWCW